MKKKQFVCACILLVSSTTHAHLLKVFAHVQSTSSAQEIQVNGKVYFTGGATLANLKIKVIDAKGELVLSPTTSDEGKFSFKIAAQDYQIIANSHDGHIAKWQINAAMPETLTPEKSTLTTLDNSLDRSLYSSQKSTQSADLLANSDQLQAVLASLVAAKMSEQLAPLSEQINTLEEKVMLQDILGALGYIFGLYGFAMWFKHRKLK